VKPLTAGMHEVKTHFSRFVQEVLAGREVIVLKSDTPVAKIVPYTPAKTTRKPGLLKGKVKTKPGFDDLPEGFETFTE
jgi:antitoxin (DNA-binding transcriptional repressor) of toxin-antitoxin stability system